MAKIDFKIEWLDAEGVKAPELVATWARLEIWVDGECITQVSDQVNRSTREGIYCSLYPLAEWIAFNWWFLQADTRVPSTSAIALASPALNGAGAAWRSRHNLRASGDGFPWPDFEVAPEGPYARLRWSADRDSRALHRIRYLTSGETYLDTPALVDSLAALVKSVLARLEDLGVAAGPLAEEWASIAGLEPDEADFCLAAGRLALDPYDLKSSISRAIVDAEKSLESGLLEEFLDAVEPTAIPTGLSWVERGARKLHSAGAAGQKKPRTLPRGADIDSTKASARPPWAQGYQQARSLRKQCTAPPAESFKVDEMVSTSTVSGQQQSLVGLTGYTSAGTPGLILRDRYPSRQTRFAQARALWHLLGSPPDRRHLVTNSNSGPQRASRAFAAELLAPAAGIAKLIEPGEIFDQATQERVAEHYGVSPFVVQHQIENQLSGPSYLMRP